MNTANDLRDLVTLWGDDVRSFEVQGRLDSVVSDQLEVLLRSIGGVVCAFGSRRLSLASGNPSLETFKPSTPVGGVPKVQKIKKRFFDRSVHAESENKAETVGVSNEPIQPEIPLDWAM